MTQCKYAYKSIFRLRSHPQYKRALIYSFLWSGYCLIWKDQPEKHGIEPIGYEYLPKYHSEWLWYLLSSVWWESFILEHLCYRNTKKPHNKQLEIRKTNLWSSISLCKQYLLFSRARCDEWWRCSIHHNQNKGWLPSNHRTHSAHQCNTQRHEQYFTY